MLAANAVYWLLNIPLFFFRSLSPSAWLSRAVPRTTGRPRRSRSNHWDSPRRWRSSSTSSVSASATTAASITTAAATATPTSAEPAGQFLRRTHGKIPRTLRLTPASVIDARHRSSGATRGAWAATASAAATTCPRRTWTATAARTTARTSAATTGSACAACASAKPGITPRNGTAASSVSATTSAATVTTTSFAEVSVTRGIKW